MPKKKTSKKVTKKKPARALAKKPVGSKRKLAGRIFINLVVLAIFIWGLTWAFIENTQEGLSIAGAAALLYIIIIIIRRCTKK